VKFDDELAHALLRQIEEGRAGIVVELSVVLPAEGGSLAGLRLASAPAELAI